MIVPMSLVRVLGPRGNLEEALAALQDFGLVHVCDAAGREDAQGPSEETVRAAEQEAAPLLSALDDVEAALAVLVPHLADAEARRTGDAEASPRDVEDAAELGRRARHEAEQSASDLAALREEASELASHAAAVEAFAPLLEEAGGGLSAFHVVLRRGEEAAAETLETALGRALGPEFSLQRVPLPGGGLALLVLVSASAAGRAEALLARADVQEAPLPREYGATAAQALPRMRRRLRELPGEIARAEQGLRGLARARVPALRAGRTLLADELSRRRARRRVALTRGVFVIEGWLPTIDVEDLRRHVEQRLGAASAVEVVSSESWESSRAPVVLSNPRLFRPFETLTRLLPLPVYGTIDPTPYIAVFFPMFFGLMLGDVAMGAALGVLSLVLRARSREGTALRSVSEIAGACALFTMIFGVLYGELLGDVGHRVLGMHPFLFSREEALVPFLVLAVSLGAVHVLLGLVLAAVGALRHGKRRREALGAGLQLAVVVGIALALLAAFEVLPRALLLPAIVTVLVLFPALVVAEGILAPVRLLTTFSHVLSYARIMAIGTASVMMAVVANRMVGALGGAVVGVLFALTFHLVNFALGLFGPALHALRLHWVEFYGEFYSPGGVRYDPLRHAVAQAATSGGASGAKVAAGAPASSPDRSGRQGEST